MKNIVLVLMLIPLISNSQIVKIDSFNGIKFGTTQTEALQTVKTYGASSNSVKLQDEVVQLSNFEFAGIPSTNAYLKFTGDRFFESILEFPVNELNFIEVFDHLKLNLVKTYGYGKDFSWFDTPFYWGDGNEFIAILKKKGKLCHAWGNTKQITADNFIVLEVCPDKMIRVVFQNTNFAKMTLKQDQQLSSNK